jgi:hypothetical protein
MGNLDKYDYNKDERFKTIQKNMEVMWFGIEAHIHAKNLPAILEEWDEDILWITGFTNHVQGIDAIVRLLFFNKGPDEDPVSLFLAAEKVYEDLYSERFSEILAKLFILSEDPNPSESLTELICLHFERSAINKQIIPRLESHKVGVAFLNFLRGWDKSGSGLLDVTRKQIISWRSKKRINPVDRMGELLGTLNPHWDRTFNKDEPISAFHLLKESFGSDAIIKYIEWYDQHLKFQQNNKARLLSIDLPYSHLKDLKPFSNSAWDDFAAEAVKIVVLEYTKELAILAGQAEKIPLHIHDDARTRLRRAIKEPKLKSLDERNESGELIIDPPDERINPDHSLDQQKVWERKQSMVRDDIDRIILDHHSRVKSDSEIAEYVHEVHGKKMSKQAVQKRRTKINVNVKATLTPPKL